MNKLNLNLAGTDIFGNISAIRIGYYYPWNLGAVKYVYINGTTVEYSYFNYNGSQYGTQIDMPQSVSFFDTNKNLIFNEYIQFTNTDLENLSANINMYDNNGSKIMSMVSSISMNISVDTRTIILNNSTMEFYDANDNLDYKIKLNYNKVLALTTTNFNPITLIQNIQVYDKSNNLIATLDKYGNVVSGSIANLTDYADVLYNDNFSSNKISNTSIVMNSYQHNLTLTGVSNINGTGNSYTNLIIGNSGSNIIDGGAGIDTLMGGKGNDTYIINSAEDIITELTNEGTDTIISSISYTLDENIENLTLAGTDNIHATGNSLNNTITGNNGNNTIDGGLSADNLTGGKGDDTYYVDNIGDIVTELYNQGTDTVISSISYILGTYFENLTLIGASNINGTGNTLNNLITGNDGNNILNGLTGIDTLVGGDGNDTYYVDNTADSVSELSNEGTDTVISSISYSLGDNLENLTLTGLANLNATGNSLDNIITSNLGIDTLIGGDGNDAYFVNNTTDKVIEMVNEGTDTVISSVNYSLADNIENLTLTGVSNINATGNSLDNIIFGNRGYNTLNGGIGSDTLVGGLGNDTYYIDNTGDVISELASQGADTVISSIDYSLEDNIENLTLIGTIDIDGTGNAINNNIIGNSGNNVIDGGLGADLLIGGLGNDTYYIDNIGDLITELYNQGTDTVISSISYTLGTYLENLTLTGSANINVTGNAFTNIITGNNGNNTLNGGAGADTLIGNDGNDTYYVDNTGDVVAEEVSKGVDTVVSSLAYTLGNNIENLTLTGRGNFRGTGNSLDNIIQGNFGIDTLIGGDGNDTYYVNNITDKVTELVNEGIDTVISSVTYSLADNIENLTLTGISNINGTGNSYDNLIIGNNGYNLINGGTGADTLIGGLGNDTYYVDNTGDVISELVNQGADTVISSIDYSLEDNLENLTLTGIDNINAEGNSLNNIITGNSGNNIIDGGLGADNLIGGKGDDTYIIDNSRDLITELYNQGNDTVVSSISYTLGTYLENLTLTGSANINGTGNVLNNIITGNGGNNILNGGIGSDALIGGYGNDTYYIDNIGDMITENQDEGIDTVVSSLAYTLGNNIENLTLTGTGSFRGTGNALDNIILGNVGSDTLTGMEGDDNLIGYSGNDILDGEIGNDTLVGGSGNDTYIFNKGFGQDTIYDTEGSNIIKFGSGISSEEIQVNRPYWNYDINGRPYPGVDLLLYIDGSDFQDPNYENQITVKGIFANSSYVKPILMFEDGTVINTNNFNIDEYQYTPGSVGTFMSETNGNDLIYSGAGNDTIYAHFGNDYINTGIGNDIIYGQEGNDTLIGASGNDILDGGIGNDIYLFNTGAGIDSIRDEAGTDLIKFGNVLNKNNIAFFKDTFGGLCVDYGSFSGEDQILIGDWGTAAYQIEKIQLNNGAYLTNTQINTIIQNMTAYASSHGIVLDSVEDVKNNSTLMNMFMVNSWHT